MIPYIESTYNISYARVAVLFVSTFIGYVAAAAATGPLVRKLGFGRTIAISVVVELMGVCRLVWSWYLTDYIRPRISSIAHREKASTSCASAFSSLAQRLPHR